MSGFYGTHSISLLCLSLHVLGRSLGHVGPSYHARLRVYDTPCTCVLPCIFSVSDSLYLRRCCTLFDFDSNFHRILADDGFYGIHRITLLDLIFHVLDQSLGHVGSLTDDDFHHHRSPCACALPCIFGCAVSCSILMRTLSDIADVVFSEFIGFLL